MKHNILLTALVCGLCLLSHGVPPVTEIDLATVEDSAEARMKAPKVEITPDGYLDVMCDNTPLSSVLQQFRRVTRQNILNSETTNLSRRVSASLTHTPWCYALQAILGMANFKMDERGGIWYVSEKTPDEVKNATRYYQLKHASAADLADLFNGVAMKTSYAERSSIRTLSTVKNPGLLNDGAGQKDANGNVEIKSALANRARATAFHNTNTLVLTGPEANLNECEKIINELDRPVTQVYIEARFIELSTEAMHKLGVQWDQLKSWGLTAKGIKAGYESNDGKAADYGTYTTQKSINNNLNEGLTSASTETTSSSLSSDGASSASSNKNKNDNETYNKTTAETSSQNGLVPSSIAEAIGAGASAASMGWRNAATFSGQLSADDFSLALSAFEQLQEGKLFSNPRIIVSNGKEARVDMTTKEPNVEVRSSRSGTEGQSLDISTKLETIPGIDRNLFAGEAFFSYGITLSVKPRVSSPGLISVEVVPTISEWLRDKEVKGASSQSSAYTTYPVIGVKSINTEFTMKDGATAVIGGLTQTSEQDVDSGIPYLRNIPWIGPKLFGWQSRQKVQKEILVCVTVGIANPETLPKDAGLPTNAILGREYVEGRRLEPGLRPHAIENITRIDTRTLDQIREDPYQQKDDDKAFDDDAKTSEKLEPPVKGTPAAEVKPVVEEPKPVETEKPITQEKSNEEPKSAEEPKPVETSKPVEATKPVETPKPVEATKPVEAPKPVAVEKPAEAPKPAPAKVEDVKPAEAPKPVAVEKLAEATKPASAIAEAEHFGEPAGDAAFGQEKPEAKTSEPQKVETPPEAAPASTATTKTVRRIRRQSRQENP